MAGKKKDQKPLEQEAREENAHADESSDIVVDAGSVESGQLSDANLSDEQLTARILGSEMVVSAEEDAVHTDNQVARAASGEVTTANAESVVLEKTRRESATEPGRAGKPKHRSDRYKTAIAAVDRSRSHPLEKALELAAKGSYSNFDGTISLHIRIQPAKKAESDSIRGLMQLPHGTGKTVNAAILTEELIEKIAKSGKTTFDVLIATPALMPQIAKIAKVLGPQGKMPSPKAGTVSDKPEEVLAALQSGRVEYRADNSNIIHQPIGKVSWLSAKLIENAQAVLGAVASYQLLSVTVSATMGPGVRVEMTQ